MPTVITTPRVTTLLSRNTSRSWRSILTTPRPVAAKKRSTTPSIIMVKTLITRRADASSRTCRRDGSNPSVNMGGLSLKYSTPPVQIVATQRALTTNSTPSSSRGLSFGTRVCAKRSMNCGSKRTRTILQQGNQKASTLYCGLYHWDSLQLLLRRWRQGRPLQPLQRLPCHSQHRHPLLGHQQKGRPGL